MKINIPVINQAIKHFRLHRPVNKTITSHYSQFKLTAVLVHIHIMSSKFSSGMTQNSLKVN